MHSGLLRGPAERRNMQITKCDRCGAEIEQGKPKFKVIIENSAPGVFRETEEVVDDLCSTCRFQLRDFFHPVEITPIPLFNSNVITGIVEKEKKEKSFWDEHDPSGGDLPPEDDENDEKSVGGGMKWIPEKTKAPARQQGEKQKRAAKVDHGKICALRKAGWSVKEICAEMHISPATVFNHLKMEKDNEEEQGM